MAWHTAVSVGWEMPAPVRPPSPTTHRWTPSAVAPEYRPAGGVYGPRRPTATPLYPVVQHHLETFLAVAPEANPMGWGVPAWVDQDFRRYLTCAILAHGFARVRCADCGQERLLAFSCKVQAELDFDQTSAFDPSDPEPLPELDFDQSLPGRWDA